MKNIQRRSGKIPAALKSFFCAPINRESILLVLVSGLTGLVFLLSTPLGHGNDEMVHLYKADALSRGAVYPKKVTDVINEDGSTYTLYGGMVPASLVDLATLTSKGRPASSCDHLDCSRPTGKIQDDINGTASRSINEELELVNFWGVNNYTPLAYIPASIGFRVAHILDTSVSSAVHLARLFNLITCIAISVVAFRVLRNSRARWIIFTVVLLPQSVLSYSLPGVDGLLNALSALLVALIAFAVLKPKNTPHPKYFQAAIIFVAIALPLIKLPYILFSLLILIPGILPRTRNWILRAVAIVLLITAPALIWNSIVSDAINTSGILVHAGETAPDSSAQLRHALAHPLSTGIVFIKSIITSGVLPATDNLTHQPGLKLPANLMLLSAVPVILSILYASRDFIRIRHRSLITTCIFLSVTAVVLGVFLALYLGYNPVGSSFIAGIQSRYFVPVYYFTALAIAILFTVDIKPLYQKERATALTLTIATPILVAIWYLTMIY